MAVSSLSSSTSPLACSYRSSTGICLTGEPSGSGSNMLQAVNVNRRNKAKLWRMTEPGKNLRDYSAACGDSQTFVVPGDCAGMRFDQALAKLLPEYSRSRLQEWIAAGQARLDGAAATAKQKVWGGETIAVQPQ